MVLASSAQAEDDWIEFADADEARACGWVSKDGASLEVVKDASAGATALRVQGGPEAKPYTGAVLKYSIDLSEAGPDDKIVFYVKQNYRGGIYLNIQTEAGHLYRSASLTPNEWTRVEFDLDITKWEGKAEAWGPVTAFSFYHKSFDQPGEFMMLDGLRLTVGGRVVEFDTIAITGPPSWEFPCETDAAWYLGNDLTAWGISKKTGQVVGGWNLKHRERCLKSGRNRYHVEDINSLRTAWEDGDTIQEVDFDAESQTQRRAADSTIPSPLPAQRNSRGEGRVRGGKLSSATRLTLQCVNRTLPELQIIKEYQLQDFHLDKRTSFRWTGERGKFITYNSEAAFMPDYRQDGFYVGAGFVGPIVPAPDLSGWKKVLTYKSTTKGMLLHQPNRDYAFAHVRRRIDDKFVWPWFSGAIHGYVEDMNALHYTPDGWDMSLGTSPLTADWKTSFEEYYRVVPGNWFTWLAETFPTQPEVRAETARIPEVPDWVGDVRAFLSFGRGGLARVRRIVESTDEGYVMVLVGHWGSWADYYVDDGLEGADGGWIIGPELRDMIRSIQAISPRVKVGIYQWVASAMPSSRIYKNHPEWFRVNDKEGNPQTTFPGHEVNYASMFSVPECRGELLREFDLVLSYLDTDFIYLDDPKAMNMVNWNRGDFTRDDLSYELFLDLRRTVAKHGNDKMLFFNCRGNPYGDVNFTEARDQLRAGWWRDFAGLGACMEAFLSVRPKARMIPLYWIDSLAREYVNRVLALGWIPSLTYGSDVGRLPFARASYEMGNSHQVNAVYSPDWKVDPGTKIESYLTQREGDSAYLLSLISHEEEESNTPVTLDLSNLKLGETIYIWNHWVEDATTFNGTATDAIAGANYAEKGWHLDRVVQRRLEFAGKPGDQLKLDIHLNPLILHQLYITSGPAAVYSVDNLPNNYLFSRNRGVTTESHFESDTLHVTVNSSRDTAEVMVPVVNGGGLSTTLNGQSVSPTWIAEGNTPCALFSIPKGHHELQIQRTSAKVERPSVTNMTARVKGEELVATLVGVERAVFTLSTDGRVLFNREVTQQDGLFRIPLADVCDGGEYELCCRAAVQDGIWPLSEQRVKVTLPERTTSLGIADEAHPRIPEKCLVQSVNKTVRNVKVLRSAEFTTSTPLIGWQPKLKALVAETDAENLKMHAGTTRKIFGFRGSAYSGLEIENLRAVKLKLENTYCTATHNRGKGQHQPQYQRSKATFGGIVVDYHTPEGYTHRTGYAIGLLAPDCTATNPRYGKKGPFDKIIDLGPIVDEGPEKTLTLNLAEHAPEDWDGRGVVQRGQRMGRTGPSVDGDDFGGQ